MMLRCAGAGDDPPEHPWRDRKELNSRNFFGKLVEKKQDQLHLRSKTAVSLAGGWDLLCVNLEFSREAE